MWRACDVHALHELLSREFIDALATHLVRALDRCACAGIAEPTILEVGAGSGALSRHLASELERRGRRVRVVASDNGSACIARLHPVERLDCEAALAAHAPQLVLACWMPSGVDWTAAFRACASVREYVLVGEPDSSTCGDVWASWGVLPSRPDEYGINESSVPPWDADGYVRAELDDVAQYQLCRFDSAAARGYSTSVAFASLAGLRETCDAWPAAAPEDRSAPTVQLTRGTTPAEEERRGRGRPSRAKLMAMRSAELREHEETTAPTDRADGDDGPRASAWPWAPAGAGVFFDATRVPQDSGL